MTREEQIEQESYRWFLKDFYETNGGENPDQEDVENAFQRGAEWADQHPHWIPVEERLPREQGKYMFYFSNGDMCYETYYPKLKLLGNVTHWMPIVPPRKEENDE